MKKIDLTIQFDDDKLDALTFYLRKKNTAPLKELSKTMDTLYQETVPQEVREYIESKIPAPSRPKPKPPAKPAVPVPAKEDGKKADG